MQERYRLLVVIAGWLALNLAAYIANITSINQLIIWMLIQHLWFIFGALAVIQDRKMLQWGMPEIVWGFVAGVGIFLLNSLINTSIFTALGGLFGVDQVAQWLTQEQSGIHLLLGVEQPSLRLGVAVMITIGAPLGEELFFRGALLPQLRNVMSDNWAIFTTAFCFALVHFYVIQFIPVFISGLLLGLLFVAKGSLIRPLVAHATVNIISLLIYTL